MYRALSIPPQLWVSDGVSNHEGALTNLTEEVALTEGVWEVTGTVPYQLQTNRESGQGMGVGPQTWFGLKSEVNVQVDTQWTAITVDIGETWYLVIRKLAGEDDGTFFVNKNAGPA